MTAWLYVLFAVCLVNVVWNIWTIVRAPGHEPNYLQPTWSLLVVALPVSMLVRSATRVLMLIVASATLTGVAVNLWNAAQAQGDWVNYFVAALLLLSLVAVWLASRWSGPGRDKAARTTK